MYEYKIALIVLQQHMDVCVYLYLYTCIYILDSIKKSLYAIKKSYILSEESCKPSKEPYMLFKKPYIPSKEPCFLPEAHHLQ